MSNELLIIFNLLVTFGGVLLAFRYFGRYGLYCWIVFAAVTANIEVMIVVDAFGIEQTLGNILFASSFTVTDILSELYGKKAANKGVVLGMFTSLFFISFSQMWLMYSPAAADIHHSAISSIFNLMPRLLIASVSVYGIVQTFDVFAYHAIWKRTSSKWGNSHKFLWLRNNVATLTSQLLNALLYTYAAFYGIYDNNTLISIVISSYAIFFIIALLDTPVVYLARHMEERKKAKKEAAI